VKTDFTTHADIYIGTKGSEQFSNIISNPRLLSGMKKLSPNQLISSVEYYHDVINHFAPKRWLSLIMECIADIEYNTINSDNNHRLLIATF